MWRITSTLIDVLPPRADMGSTLALAQPSRIHAGVKSSLMNKDIRDVNVPYLLPILGWMRISCDRDVKDEDQFLGTLVLCGISCNALVGVTAALQPWHQPTFASSTFPWGWPGGVSMVFLRLCTLVAIRQYSLPTLNMSNDATSSLSSLLFTRAPLALSRTQRLVSTWLPPPAAEELARSTESTESQREDDETLMPSSEL